MRQNLIIALLAVCATLLAVNLVVHLTRPQPLALGQTAAGVADPGGNYVLATGVTASGNESILYVFQTQTRRLAAYVTRTRGIEFRGVRTLEHDLKADWLAPSGGRILKPDEVAKAVRDAEAKGKKKKR